MEREKERRWGKTERGWEIYKDVRKEREERQKKR
jgi:hypothetical protein